MNTINDFDFQGKKALIRVDFNVPLNEKFEVTDLKNQNVISTNQTSKTSFKLSRNNCGNANDLFKVVLNLHKL